MTNPNDPAYPEVYIAGNGQRQEFPGLTKREYFAAMAFAGMDIGNSSPMKAAIWAVEYADALIAALNDGKK